MVKILAFLTSVIGPHVTLVGRCELNQTYYKHAIEYLAYTSYIVEHPIGLAYEGTLNNLDQRLEKLAY